MCIPSYNSTYQLYNAFSLNVSAICYLLLIGFWLGDPLESKLTRNHMFGIFQMPINLFLFIYKVKIHKFVPHIKVNQLH